MGNDAYNQCTDVSKTFTVIGGRRVTREQAAHTYIGLKVFLYEHFNLARLILNQGRPIIEKITRRDCEDFTQQYISVQAYRMRNHLKQDESLYNLAKNGIHQILRIKNVPELSNTPIIIALIPDENQINPSLQRRILIDEEYDKYDFDMPQSMLIGMFQSADIDRVIDLLPAFRKDSRCMYMNDSHWTPEGHELTARVISEGIASYLPE